MTLEDKFAGMAINEPIKIEVEGEELELDMRVQDIVPLMSMGAQQGEEAEIGEDDIEKLTDTFREILYRTYLPHYDDIRGQEPENLSERRQEENEEVKEYINGLLVRKLPQMINKIVNELGWNEGDVPQQDFPK